MKKRLVTLTQILSCLGSEAQFLGDPSVNVDSPSPIEAAHANALAYCADQTSKALDTIRKSKARVIICSDRLQFEPSDYRERTLVLVPDPQAALAAVIREFFEERTQFGVSASAHIDKDAKIHPNVYIGPHCTIGRCEIGEGTIVYGNVYIFPDTRIGRNVVINPGTVIGAEGVLMTWKTRLPHTGGVVIGDDAQIGANVAIQRGMLSDTVIGDSTIVGHACTVGHQTTVGKHCIIVTHSTVGGSCRIGDYAQISLGARVRDKINIGDHAIVGMGAVVTKDVGDRWVVVGIPATKIREVD